MDFIRKKAVEATSGSPAPTESKGDVTLWGDRGWTGVSITGERGEAPQTFEELVKEGYRKNPVVAGGIRILSSAMTEPDLQAQVRNDEGKWVKAPNDHPAQELIDRPNERDSQVQWIERGVLHFLLGGNAFWKINRNGIGRPDSLIPIRPDQILSAMSNEDNIPFGYEKFVREGKNKLIAADDIIHVPDSDPLMDIFGVPRLLSAALEIDADTAASEYVTEVLDNHGQPGMLVGVDGTVHRSQLDRAEKMFEQKFGPGKGRGKVGFVAGAKSIRVIGFNLKELEFPNLRQVTRESILTALGIDPLIAGVSSASQGSSLGGNEHEEARKKLYFMTVIPMIKRFEAELNHSLAPLFGSGVRFKFDLGTVQALQADRTEAVQRAARMAQLGVFSAEEIREEAGLDADLPDGASVLVTDLQHALNQVDALDAGTGPDGPEITPEEINELAEADLADYPNIESGT